MGQKAYLNVDGIRGSSYELGHVGEMNIDTFSIGYNQGAQSKEKKVKVSIEMEMEPSFSVFYGRLVHNEKFKEATLTVENIDRSGYVSQTYKIEMEGLKVTEVTSVSPNVAGDVRNPNWRLSQRVSFLVDVVQPPRFAHAPATDEWTVR